MRFKTERIKQEWLQLNTKNPKLAFLVSSLSAYCEQMFKKDVMLTEVFRTEEEQKALYSKSSQPPKNSPHMSWCAVDIRSFDFTKEQIDKILDFCNKSTDNWFKKTAIYHEIPGNVYHLHLQYSFIKEKAAA